MSEANLHHIVHSAIHHIDEVDASFKFPRFYDIIIPKKDDYVKENKLAELQGRIKNDYTQKRLRSGC